jgi:hypothetical protein
VITVRYSGDANFLDTVPQPANVLFLGGTVSFGAMLLPGTHNVVIVGHGFDGYPPAGTISVLENETTPRTVSGPLAMAGSGSSSTTAISLSPSARTIAITYSGDLHYRPGTVTIPIALPRTHAVR